MSAVPSGLKIVPVVAGLELAWGVSTTEGLEGFLVRWRPKAAPVGVWNAVSLPVAARAYTIGGLQSETYEVQVISMIEGGLVEGVGTPGSPPPPPPPSEPTWEGYSAQHPMPAGKTPGALSSPWNQKASSAVLANSSSLVGTLLTAISGPGAIGLSGEWSKPTYYAADTDPKATLKFKAPWWGGAAGPLDGKSIHIPKGAQPAPPPIGSDPNSDSHMQVVFSPGDCKTYGVPFGTTAELWKAQWEGSTLRFQSGSYGHINGSLIGGQATAMNCDLCAGQIRAPELAASRIPHALFAVTHKAYIGTGFVSPAVHSDGSGGPIPMGQRFKLAYTAAEIAALPIPASRKAVVTAAAEYGVIIGDSSGNAFGLQAESQVMYTSLGQPNPFAPFGQWLDVTSGVDWKGRLRAVAP